MSGPSLSPSQRLQSLLDLLQTQYQPDDYSSIVDGFSQARLTSFRVNEKRTTADAVADSLSQQGYLLQQLPLPMPAFEALQEGEVSLPSTKEYEEGLLYLQSPSSMIPPLLFSSLEKKDLLDMCAAPGSKTTQLAQLGDGTLHITACEKDKIRCDRLRYNLKKQGFPSVNVLQSDARKLDDFLRFDAILLDAPCSGSGTVLLQEENTYRSYSPELVRNSAKLQLQLLNKADRLLKSGGELVYSTCSLLSAENEDVVSSFLSSHSYRIVDHPELKHLPLLQSSIQQAIKICPTSQWEGFFAIHLVKT